jgi:hypothetical protein
MRRLNIVGNSSFHPLFQEEDLMLLSYDALKSSPRLFQALTSLTPSEFLILLMAFQQAWEYEELDHLLDTCPRQREPGGGRKATLQRIEDKLLFILVYFKLYPLQAEQGALVGLSQGRANIWIHHLTKVLRTALQLEHQLPARTAQALLEKLAAEETRIAMIDGTERRQQRPQDADAQSADYSGKQKCHTKKNLLITTTPQYKVGYLSGTYPGSVHDKAVADQEALIFPEDLVLVQDTGFEGYAPEGGIVCQPKKKPKGGELSSEDKARNTLIARLRIAVEHVIAGIKRCHIVKDLFRNTTQHFDDLVMEIACGLHNFRVEYRSTASP